MEENAYSRSFRLILASRAFRSVGLIFMAISLPLYLLVNRISIVNVGLIYVGTALANVSVTIGIGMLGDRVGYKYSLMLGEIPALTASGMLAFTRSIPLIITATIISGSAGAPGGMRGSFSVGITPYLARIWRDPSIRIARMAQITFVASIASIGGSLLLYFHGFLSHIYGDIGAFEILYHVAFLLILLSFASLSMVRRDERQKKTTKFLRRETMRFSTRVIITNVINGSAIGFSMALISAWFEIRYGVSASKIGLVFTFSYITTAIGSLMASRIHISKERAVYFGSLTRILQGTLLIVMALSPIFLLGSAIYIIRTIVAGFGTPIRNVVNIQGVKDEDLGTASSIQGAPSRIMQSTSGIAGYLMDYYPPLPVEIGGVIQIIGGFVYFKLLRKY
ncbi:MFS transporter [Thermoplasma sp.]|uniref:MFS transporter n=1 Tax=Thermoplasma sp. TaxID=1973142 RepID=UPI00127FFA62|nr:MFS transporter [Thermoplasma sp.]KAA8922982.1 MAG: MFS transporter [Thermoplasma sp.]